jgi:signal peptidase I
MGIVAIGIAERLRRLTETKRHGAGEWTVTFLILLFATTFVAQPYVIPSGSMESTLMTGDHVIVDKLAYAPVGSISKRLLPYSQVRRGDIIVFRSPEKKEITLVKRVIGVPGDRIQLVRKGLVLNGRAVAEPYVQHSDPNVLGARDSMAEFIVPMGHYFAMGDNRDNSHDSRFFGFVPRENISGKPWVIYWSYESTTENLSGSPLNPDHLKDLALNFFTKTRRSRTFQFVRGYPLE